MASIHDHDWILENEHYWDDDLTRSFDDEDEEEDDEGSSV